MIKNQIAAYLDYCENIRQMSKNTILNKRAILDNFIAVTNLPDLKYLTNRVLESYLRYLFSKNAKTSTANTYLSTIIALVKFYQNTGAEIEIPLNLNNIPHFKTLQSPRKFYTAAEIRQVTRIASEVERLMIKIMFETGMRIAEISKLKVENLDGAKITFTGKGRKFREVYISAKTQQNLQKYLQKYKIDQGYIWCVIDGTEFLSGVGIKTENSTPPTVTTIRKNLQRAFEKAGLDGFYPHALRHSFATNLQKKGASVLEIKEMMGHSNIATTERYLHGFDGQLERLFKKYQ